MTCAQVGRGLAGAAGAAAGAAVEGAKGAAVAAATGAVEGVKAGTIAVGKGVVDVCVKINQCVGCTQQFFTKSFLGDDVAVLARSSGEEPASPRHRAGIASMAWKTTR